VLLGTHAGALGKRELGPFDLEPEELKRALGLEAVHEVGVERAKAAALVLKLDTAFAAGADKSLFNPKNGLTFVPDAREYSSDFHCNTVVAEWLGELGCDVGPASFVADFRVDPARVPTPAGEGQ
jgi:hypothetical protein